MKFRRSGGARRVARPLRDINTFPKITYRMVAKPFFAARLSGE